MVAMMGLLIGSTILSRLPVFQKALHDAGIDAVIAEKQAQLDAWLAAK